MPRRSLRRALGRPRPRQQHTDRPLATRPTRLGHHARHPETDDSDAVIALDTITIAVLCAHRTTQRRERLAAGPARTASRLVFTTPSGRPLHPADVTDHFHELAPQAGLPPIRLHDVRHGAATLAAGVDMKIISAQLRHSDPHFTAATYAHILPELAHTGAEATAAMVPLNLPRAG